MYGDDRRQGRGGCIVIFFIVLISGIAIGLYYWVFTGRVPKRVILEADFEQGMIESVPDDGLARVLMTKKLRVRDVVEALQKASQDDRVKGLVARVGQSSVRLAQVQEVRDAIIAFRAAGKPAIAYAETFGEAGRRELFLLSRDRVRHHLSAALGRRGADRAHLRTALCPGDTGQARHRPAP